MTDFEPDDEGMAVVRMAITDFNFADYGLDDVDPRSEYAEWVGDLASAITGALAVLPAPADRAAVLREAADDLAAAFGDPMAKHIGLLGAAHLRRRAREVDAGRPGLRRMVDEAQQPEEAGR